MSHAPKDSMGVVVTLKSKMAASRVWPYLEYSGSVSSDLSDSSNKSSEPLLDVPTTSEDMSALLPFKCPPALLDSFVTTTPTMHVRAAKALFDVIIHKVYNALNSLHFDR